MAKGKEAVAELEPVQAADAAQTEAGTGGNLIDFSSVPEEAEFVAIPRGIYPATVDDVTYGHSQSSGNPMWTWKFEISEGEYAGRKLFYHSPFVENMLPRVKKVLSRIAPELLATAFDPEEVASQGTLLGKACKLRIDVKVYEGKNRNNVRDVLPPDGTAAAGSDFL